MYNVDDRVYYIHKFMSLQGCKGKIVRIKKFIFWKKYLIANEYLYDNSSLYWVKEKNIIKKL